MARIDRLAFYNAYAVWRENMGEKGVNLQDVRYGFRSQITEAMREFARRAMRAGVSKRKRALVKILHFTFPGETYLLSQILIHRFLHEE